MSSIADSDAAEVLAGLCGAVDALSELDTSALTRHDRLAILRDVETLLRRIPAATHGIINELVAGHVPGQFGGASMGDVLADTLRITRADARRRIRDAAELAPTVALTGTSIEPVLAATSAAQRAGTAGGDHIAVIRRFWDRVPRTVDVQTRMTAERQLARLTQTLRGPMSSARQPSAYWPISIPMAVSPAIPTGLAGAGSGWVAKARTS